MHGACVVVPLLNGLAHFARLDGRFGREQVMGGTCTISVTLRTDGVIEHLDANQRLIGERDRTRLTRAQALADALAPTRIDWELSEDIERSMWEKIVSLSTLAAVTCLFRANVGEINRAPGGPDAIERTLATSIEIAARGRARAA